MEFGKMFETQREFDKKFKTSGKHERVEKKLLALLVEQGEVLNETPAVFKFWMSNPKPSSRKQAEKYAQYYRAAPVIPEKDTVLEELVDMLHFILSIGLELEVTDIADGATPVSSNNPVSLHLHFAHAVSGLYFQVESGQKDIFIGAAYAEVLRIFLGIAGELGYSKDDLEEAYYRKNKINIDRQENGY